MKVIQKNPKDASAIIIYFKKKILLVLRSNKKNIFYPNHYGLFGGAKENNETYIKTANRELYEETGCQSVELVGQTTDWILYDLPQALVKKSWGGKFRGQAQKWFVFHFKGDDKEFDLAKTEKPEFSEWKWTNIYKLDEFVVDFKRPVYKLLVSEFRHYSDSLSKDLS